MAQQTFHGEIEVRRVLTQVRVVDTAGEPVASLGPADFSVTLNGQPVEVEAADWVDTSPPAVEPSAPGGPARPEPGPPSAGIPVAPRLVVLVFQTDFNPVRLTGLYRMSHYATEFVRGLGERDRVALVVFGSHLQLHLDFTADLDGLCELLAVPSLVQNLRAEAPPTDGPSLASHLDLEAARDAATFSQGLRVLGEALEALPGRKEVVLFAWGIGRYTGDSVWLGRDYNDAKLALARAHATVYSLDVTSADYHDLEVGLSRISHDTGGFYVKTHLFPTQAIQRLEAALAGYYELTLVAPDEVGDYFSVEVGVDRPGCSVMAAPLQAATPPS
jgi:VWFA-related protein